MDTESFIVESVRDHIFEGKGKLQSNLKLRIHWQGFDDSQDTWEPFTNVSKVEVVHQYLIAHHLAKFIPKGFKYSKPETTPLKELTSPGIHKRRPSNRRTTSGQPKKRPRI